MRENENNPQHRQMADASMVRNLQHQANAIWPQEAEIFRGYRLSGALDVLDVGCGTGEISARLAELYPQAAVVGVDLIARHLQLARERCAGFGTRVLFREADAFALPFADATFDLVRLPAHACRRFRARKRRWRSSCASSGPAGGCTFWSKTTG